MPAKKKEVDNEKPRLGRVRNTLKIGIVGLPNVGKSTTFNCLTGQSVASENRPFCTIDKNEAVCKLEDKRFDYLVEKWNPKSRVNAVIQITDIAGLVSGANEGEGLGNEFLSHIDGVDGLMQVVRCFDDDEVTHVEGTVDPVRDLEIIKNELILKDLDRISKIIDDLERKTRAKKDKDIELEVETLKKTRRYLETNKKVIEGEWTTDDVFNLNKYLFLTSKPSMYLCNVDLESYKKKGNKWLMKVKEWVDSNGGGLLIPYSASYEERALAGNPEEGVPSSLNKIIKGCYKTLDLIHFFTAGEDEVRQWTVRAGSKAPQAAGIIHTDFERGFISADAYTFEHFKEHGSEHEVKAKGLLRTHGKEYVVNDGDILFFRFNVSKNTTKK